MDNYRLRLPKALHSSAGIQQKVEFEMSRRHFDINGVQYDNPLIYKFTHEFKGYIYNIMNTYIIVTLFYDKDVLRNI